MKGKTAEFNVISFICPICGVHSRQIWGHYGINGNVEGVYTKFDVLYDNPGSMASSPSMYEEKLSIALCSNCENHSVWMNMKLIYPNLSTAPLPTENMPEDVLLDYIEARNVLTISPRSSAALLRLALQKLCIRLGGKGKNINDDIKNLVENGLPEKIQKALDIVRVIGNDSVHPGQIDVSDNPEIASSLFQMINIIVDKMITEPKTIDGLFESLPEDKRKGIEIRDAKKSD
ncbi:DUF4145 domain-containing protein [Proteiniclasticum ruminis]|uniref:DUF4145 domain-containing protein n=1 Tax=Proteiniclasticum ruminis TaxID=398199 RepID=A0A1I5EU12_9CLOT|nr:DUF4145 domain-containing protein [Proteiniclasticum ruminis]SFO14937.1 protein of unknown function [Proteiniclasticum ruminis]